MQYTLQIRSKKEIFEQVCWLTVLFDIFTATEAGQQIVCISSTYPRLYASPRRECYLFYDRSVFFPIEASENEGCLGKLSSRLTCGVRAGKHRS